MNLDSKADALLKDAAAPLVLPGQVGLGVS